MFMQVFLSMENLSALLKQEHQIEFSFMQLIVFVEPELRFFCDSIFVLLCHPQYFLVMCGCMDAGE